MRVIKGASRWLEACTGNLATPSKPEASRIAGTQWRNNGDGVISFSSKTIDEVQHSLIRSIDETGCRNSRRMRPDDWRQCGAQWPELPRPCLGARGGAILGA